MSTPQTSQLTIMFADLAGSTSFFERLGNEKATQAITKITRWIADVGVSQGGRTIKQLGDGVLLAFSSPVLALQAAVQLQRRHSEHLTKWPPDYQIPFKIGIADGEVIEVDGDTYGDAVNTAARLSDMAGSNQIWAVSSVAAAAPALVDYRVRNLGVFNIRGKSQPAEVFAIDWAQEIATSMLTIPGMPAYMSSQSDPQIATIELRWLDVQASFTTPTPPIEVGRQNSLDFVVDDPRVSRVHAVITCDNGVWRLDDLSSYGTWVRFKPGNLEIALRRNSCVLHDHGEIALGAPFSDFSAPTVSFSLSMGKLDAPQTGSRGPT
jgi:adenylate cyclase